MLFIILFYLLFAGFLATPYSDFLPFKNVFKAFWGTFNIDCMAIGGIYAILLFNKSKLIDLLLNKYLFYLLILIVCVCMYKNVRIPFVHYEFYSVLFGIIILNFACNKEISISLENKVLNYLGNISYG